MALATYGVVLLPPRGHFAAAMREALAARPWLQECCTDVADGARDGAVAAAVQGNAFNVCLSAAARVNLAGDAAAPLLALVGRSPAGVERLRATPAVPRCQLVNHFANAAAVTHKAAAIRALNAVLAAGEDGGPRRHVFDVIPTAFYFSGPAATDTQSPVLQAFLRRFAAGAGARVDGERMPAKHCRANLWIIKGAAAGSAATAVVCNTAVDIKTCMSSLRGDFVVQKYVERPLLVAERKVVMRLLVLVLDSGDAFMHDAPLVLLSSAPYSDVTAAHMPAVSLEALQRVHLTTPAAAQHDASLPRTAAQLQAYIDAHMGDLFPPQALQRMALATAQRVVADVISHALSAPLAESDAAPRPALASPASRSASPSRGGGGSSSAAALAAAPAPVPGGSNLRSGSRGRRCYEVFGADFLLDEDLRPWFLGLTDAVSVDDGADVRGALTSAALLAVDRLCPPDAPEAAAALLASLTDAATAVAPSEVAAARAHATTYSAAAAACGAAARDGDAAASAAGWQLLLRNDAVPDAAPPLPPAAASWSHAEVVSDALPPRRVTLATLPRAALAPPAKAAGRMSWYSAPTTPPPSPPGRVAADAAAHDTRWLPSPPTAPAGERTPPPPPPPPFASDAVWVGDGSGGGRLEAASLLRTLAPASASPPGSPASVYYADPVLEAASKAAAAAATAAAPPPQPRRGVSRARSPPPQLPPAPSQLSRRTPSRAPPARRAGGGGTPAAAATPPSATALRARLRTTPARVDTGQVRRAAAPAAPAATPAHAPRAAASRDAILQLAGALRDLLASRGSGAAAAGAPANVAASPAAPPATTPVAADADAVDATGVPWRYAALPRPAATVSIDATRLQELAASRHVRPSADGVTPADDVSRVYRALLAPDVAVTFHAPPPPSPGLPDARAAMVAAMRAAARPDVAPPTMRWYTPPPPPAPPLPLPPLPLHATIPYGAPAVPPLAPHLYTPSRAERLHVLEGAAALAAAAAMGAPPTASANADASFPLAPAPPPLPPTVSSYIVRGAAHGRVTFRATAS